MNRIDVEPTMSVVSLPKAEPIRILVLHADPIARAGLSYACAKHADLEVHEAASVPDEAMRPGAPAAAGVDIVIADYASGLALATRGKQGPPQAFKILIVSGSDREYDI